MSIDYQSLAVKGVQALSPYQPGKPIDELARELGLKPDNIIKLASNENPLGPSPKALAAVKGALTSSVAIPMAMGLISSRHCRPDTAWRPLRLPLATVPTMSWR